MTAFPAMAGYGMPGMPMQRAGNPYGYGPAMQFGGLPGMGQQFGPQQQAQWQQGNVLNPPMDPAGEEERRKQAAWAQQTQAGMGTLPFGPMQDQTMQQGPAMNPGLPGTPSGIMPRDILPGLMHAYDPGGVMNPASNFALPQTPMGAYNQQQGALLSQGTPGAMDTFEQNQNAAFANPALRGRLSNGQPMGPTTTTGGMPFSQFASQYGGINSTVPEGYKLPDPQQMAQPNIGSAAQFAAMNHSMPYQTNPAYAHPPAGMTSPEMAMGAMAQRQGLHVLPTPGGGQVVSPYDSLNHPSVYDQQNPLNSYGKPILRDNMVEGTKNWNPLAEAASLTNPGGATPQQQALAMQRMGPGAYWAAKAASGHVFSGPELGLAGLPQPQQTNPMEQQYQSTALRTQQIVNWKAEHDAWKESDSKTRGPEPMMPDAGDQGGTANGLPAPPVSVPPIPQNATPEQRMDSLGALMLTTDASTPQGQAQIRQWATQNGITDAEWDNFTTHIHRNDPRSFIFSGDRSVFGTDPESQRQAIQDRNYKSMIPMGKPSMWGAIPARTSTTAGPRAISGRTSQPLAPQTSAELRAQEQEQRRTAAKIDREAEQNRREILPRRRPY